MQTLLLLHGAIGAQDQLISLAELLSPHYNVHRLNFSGHGGKVIPDERFSIKLFANDVLSYMRDNNLTTVSIFGYSMGGYVGMYLAKYHPEKVNAVITLATKYHWDEAIAAKEVQMLDPEKIAAKLPVFAKTLEERHAPADWKKVLSKTAKMMLDLGSDNALKMNDHESIETPALIMLGDRDKMVGMDETVAVYKALPHAQLAILPNTPHPIEQVDKELLGYFIKRTIPE